MPNTQLDLVWLKNSKIYDILRMIFLKNKTVKLMKNKKILQIKQGMSFLTKGKHMREELIER